jgi:hypothetical protein
MRMDVSIEKTILHPLAPFYPVGIERLRINQTHSVSNVQPYYSAGDLPAKENDQMNKQLILTVWIVLATLTLAACGPTGTSLSPAEGAAYAAEVDEYVENMLVGQSECDFDKTHRGFDKVVWEEQLRDKSAWQQECEADLAVTGAYQSKTLDHVEDRQELRVVIYHVVFEKGPDVTLRMYFYIDDPDHLIVGIDRE